MKKILKNLIPPALYWITFARGFFCKCKANEMGHFGAVHSAFAVGNYSNRFDRQERISRIFRFGKLLFVWRVLL